MYVFSLIKSLEDRMSVCICIDTDIKSKEMAMLREHVSTAAQNVNLLSLMTFP